MPNEVKDEERSKRRAWYAKNREKEQARKREWYAANREKECLRKFKYYWEHHEKCLSLKRLNLERRKKNEFWEGLAKVQRVLPELLKS